MASTYSDLKIELIGTGEQAGTWGATTNNNLGTAIEQALVGKADIAMSSTTITLTLTNTNAAQDARAIYLNLTGSPGGAAVLEVPAIEKPYIVKNGSDQQVTIKVSGQTGVAIPTGKTTLVYNNGTDVVSSIDYAPGLTLGAALNVASGGTGASTFTDGGVLIGNGSSAIQATSAGTAGELFRSGGAGVDPAFTDKLSVTATGFTNPVAYGDTVVALGNTSTAKTIDCQTGNVFTATLTDNCTFTLSNAIATGATSFTLILTNDGTPSRSVTLAGGTFNYPDGSISRTEDANAVDIWFFFTVDGGSNWYVSIPMKNLST